MLDQCHTLSNCWIQATITYVSKQFGHLEILQVSVTNINTGSYMSAHVLLNLLNELGKRDKMRGLSSILSLFHELNKFNNTRAQMLDYIYHMTLKHLKIAFLV